MGITDVLALFAGTPTVTLTLKSGISPWGGLPILPPAINATTRRCAVIALGMAAVDSCHSNPIFQELAAWNSGAGRKVAFGINALWRFGYLKKAELHTAAWLLDSVYRIRQAATNIGAARYGVGRL